MSLSKEIDAITECSICTESFVDPRLLPCLHTFCLKCLESYGKSRQSEENLNCPICRANFVLPAMKFTNLPVNFFIQKLLEVNKISDGPTDNACDACSDQGDCVRSASVYCFDCRQSLCAQCGQVHNKLRYNRSHQVVEFGKKQAEELLKVSPTFCDAHQDEIVKFYCSDCEATICMSCYVEEHNSHKCSNILKVSDGFLQRLREDTSKVSQHIKKCFSEEEKLKRKKIEFLQDIKRKELQIAETIKELHELVDAYGKRSLTKVKSIKEVKLKEFELTENEIHDHLMMMESYKRYSDEVMSKATPADVTRLSNMLRKRAAELHAIKLDNDLQVFDVEIISSKLKDLLVDKVENPICDFMVYNSRKDFVKSFMSPYTFVPILVAEKKAIFETATIGNELYLLSKDIKANTNIRKRCIGSEIVTLSLSSASSSSLSGVQVSSYTTLDSIIFHLQLWVSISSAGQTLQLQVSNFTFAENDDNSATFVTFNLPPHITGQLSNSSENIAWLKCPQKLFVHGIEGIYFNPHISSTATAITMQPSVQFYISDYDSRNQSNYLEDTVHFNSEEEVYDKQEECVYLNQDDAVIDIPFTEPSTTPLPSSILLEVYDTNSDPTKDIPTATSKTIGGAVIKVKLPDTFITKDGNPEQRTSYTQSDSVLLHIQLNYTEKSSSETAALELRIAKLTLTDSEGLFVSSANLSVQPYSIEVQSDANHDITLKATRKLINAGFHGIDLRFKVGTTQDTVKVQASVISISAINEDCPSEKIINFPTSTRVASLRLRRTINLPSTIDPSGMVSCNYHQCIYIGDRQSSSIYRVEPIGRIRKWQVTKVPDGLSVTPDHTLIVTCGKSSKLYEYDTHGVLFRDIKLVGLNNPLHSVVVADRCFLVVTGSAPIYLASIVQSKFGSRRKRSWKSVCEYACIKEIVLFSNSTAKLDQMALQTESLEGNIVATQELLAVTPKRRPSRYSQTKASFKSHAQVKDFTGTAKDCPKEVQVSFPETECQSVEVSKRNDVKLDGPVHVVVDRFGFVLILTTNDAKVHLLSPQLNYVRELIALSRHGMEKPSRIHFDNESGILYVQSNDGHESLLGFQITEGKVDPSVWKKDI